MLKQVQQDLSCYKEGWSYKKDVREGDKYAYQKADWYSLVYIKKKLEGC